MSASVILGLLIAGLVFSGIATVVSFLMKMADDFETFTPMWFFMFLTAVLYINIDIWATWYFNIETQYEWEKVLLVETVNGFDAIKVEEGYINLNEAYKKDFSSDTPVTVKKSVGQWKDGWWISAESDYELTIDGVTSTFSDGKVGYEREYINVDPANTD